MLIRYKVCGSNLTNSEIVVIHIDVKILIFTNLLRLFNYKLCKAKRIKTSENFVIAELIGQVPDHRHR